MFLIATDLYTIVAMFGVLCVLIGVALAYYNLELFSMFLWLVESVVILSLLLVLFCFFATFMKYKTLKLPILLLSFMAIFCYGLLAFITSPITVEGHQIALTSAAENYINFGTDIGHITPNDFLAIFIALYKITAFEFIIVGFLLLITSLVVIFLYKHGYQKNEKIFLDFFKSKNLLNNFAYLRKQNVFFQGLKKIKTWFFKNKN